MSELTVVQFETSTFDDQTYVSELSDGPPYTVHGVALGADDVTVGQSGIKKLWPAEELQVAAKTLKGTDLVVDHNNGASGVVGRVTKSGYKEETGVVYEAELYDDDLAEKIENGLLEVSIRGYHADVDSLEEDEEKDAKIVEDIEFDNLSIVPTGASPSNTLQMGAHAELSAAELSAFTDSLDEAALAEIEPGMWVTTGDTHGITISQVQDGEIEVDVYEESDGKWRSTEQTEMFDTDSLDEWDVDEEEDIGTPEKEEEDGEDSDEEENASLLEAGIVFFDTVNDSTHKIASIDGNMVTIEGEDGDMWKETKEDVFEKIAEGEWEHASGEKMATEANYSRGDWVRWDTRNSTEIGKVLGSYTEGDDIPEIRGSRGLSPEGDEILYTLRMYKERDGSYHPIEGKPIAHYEDSVRSTEKPSDVSDSSVELGRSNHENYDVKEEEWVQWYPSDMSEEHGFVLDVDESAGDDDEKIVTIEVWTQNDDGEWETDGEEITKEMELVEPWGNFPREQEEFADAIEDGDPRKAVKPSEEENADAEELISEQVKDSLKDKAEKHNEEHGDEEGKEVTYRMLKNVFERGMGAYQDSHREGMTPQQWSYARVNAFLYLVRNGNPENDSYTQDNDLLPEDHPKYNEAGDEEENAAMLEPSDGEFVKWKGVNNEPQFGQIVGVEQDGSQMVASIRRFTKNGDALDELVEKPLQGLDKWDRMDAENDPDYMRDDSPSVQAPTWEDGQMVKWQVNPAMKGKIVHVDREKKVLMVEVMEDTEQGLQPTGYTLTAGYQDVVPMDKEMAASTTRDVPTQSAQPDHETDSVNNLLKRFIEERGDSQPSLSEFVEWMDSENLSMRERGEGEEEVLDSKQKLEDSHHGEPHRYTDAEDEATELAERYDDYPEAASENAQMALDAREETDNPNDCGTDVGWKRANQLANGEGLTREQVGKMSAFNRHRSNSEQSEEEGREDCGWMMWKAWGGDEGVDWAQQKLDSIEEENSMDDIDSEHVFASRDEAMEMAKELGLDGVHEMGGRWVPGNTHEEYMDQVASNSKYGDDEDEMTSADEGDDSSDAEELQEYEMHTPDWSGTTTADWSSPDLEDFDTDDLSEVANHFLISSTGFPPENFTDLKLPVVEPNGDLNVNALAAVKGGRGVSAVDGLESEMEGEIVDWVNNAANEEFDKDWGMEEEENAQADEHEIGGTAGRPTPGENTVGGVRVLSGDDLQQWRRKSEESDADSLETYNITTMNEEIEEKLSELDEPVAVEATEVEELRNKADRFEEMSENLEALRERTDILDEVDRSQVEELAEAEDPVVEESARYEQLQSEAEQVSGVYAAQLAEEYPAFSAEELTDKFSIEELREKFEEQIGDVEEELASSESAEPRSQDADEESLEDAAEDADTSEEELSNEVAEKQEEIRNKILR